MSGTTRTTARCMNASTIAFVPKEDSEGTHSSLKIFSMTILITGIPVWFFGRLFFFPPLQNGHWVLNTMTTNCDPMRVKVFTC